MAALAGSLVAPAAAGFELVFAGLLDMAGVAPVPVPVPVAPFPVAGMVQLPMA